MFQVRNYSNSHLLRHIIVVFRFFLGFLCHALLKEPNLIQNNINEFVYNALRKVFGNNDVLQLNQVFVPIVIEPLDIFENYPARGLCNIKGILSMHSMNMKHM